MIVRRFSLMCILAIVALPSANPGCVSAADKITLSSTNPTAFDVDYVVAREKGFFAKENLEPEPTYMTPELVVKALIAGTVDLARSGTHFGLIAAVRGAEIKIIGGTNYGYAYQVIANPQFKTLADLKGQRIAGASLGERARRVRVRESSLPGVRRYRQRYAGERVRLVAIRTSG